MTLTTHRSTNTLSGEVVAAYRSCSWAELALLRQGWTAERLQKAAHKATNDYAKLNIPYLEAGRREDLVDFVLEKALVAVMGFKPDHPTHSYGANGGSHFDSWIYDVMLKRCIDWHRSKAEGNGDRRYGNDNRIVLDDDPDPADHDVDFERLVDRRRLARWQAAANLKDMSLSDFVVSVLDIVSEQIADAA